MTLGAKQSQGAWYGDRYARKPSIEIRSWDWAEGGVLSVVREPSEGSLNFVARTAPVAQMKRGPLSERARRAVSTGRARPAHDSAVAVLH